MEGGLIDPRLIDLYLRGTRGMGNCQADNQGRLLEYERFPFGSDLLGAIQRGKDIRYIIFSRQAPWDDKIKYGIFPFLVY